MCKLMILDDDPIQHLLLKRMLIKHNMYSETLYSFDGNEVLDFLKQHQEDIQQLPKLLFIDINMPRMNGWIFLERLRQLYPHLKKLIDVYVISSSIDPNEIKRTNNYQFVKSYIVKPLTSEKLDKILNTIT